MVFAQILGEFHLSSYRAPLTFPRTSAESQEVTDGEAHNFIQHETPLTTSLLSNVCFYFFLLTALRRQIGYVQMIRSYTPT